MFHAHTSTLLHTLHTLVPPHPTDFCKHIFVPNFAEVLSNVVAITDENKALLESGYEARTEKELAVLTRWFPGTQVKPVKAEWWVGKREKEKKLQRVAGGCGACAGAWCLHGARCLHGAWRCMYDKK